MTVAESNRLRRKYRTHEEAKAAQYASAKAWARRNPDKVSEQYRRYRIKHREKNLLRLRASTLKRRFGMTPEDYDQMLLHQGGVCAICRGKNPDGRRLSIDHCHKTNKVRALLCMHCNLLLGHADDDIDLLQKCISYVKEHQ